MPQITPIRIEANASELAAAAAALTYGPWFTYRDKHWIKASTVEEVRGVGAFASDGPTHLLQSNGHTLVCKAPTKVVLLALSMAMAAENEGGA